MSGSNPCDPQNQAPRLRAAAQANGKDVFSEAERLKNMKPEQTFNYEDYMSKNFGFNPKKPDAPNLYDVIKQKSPKNQAPGLLSDRHWAAPSETFSKKFYGAIDKKVSTWANSKNADRASYNEQVAKPVRTLLAAIDKVTTESKTNAQLNANLSKLGLKSNQLYDARDYLRWLADGGHLQQDEHLKGLGGAAKNIAKAQSNLQFVWTMGNGIDMLRIGSHYATKSPKGPIHVMTGIADAVKATGGNPFKRLPELEKQHIYDSAAFDRGQGFNNFFSHSIIAQKNIAYYLDKASGGDGYSGMRDIVFENKPWDQAFAYRTTAHPLLYGLARFPISESRWYLNTTKKALTGDKSAAANLLLFSAMKYFVTGSKSLVPAPIYMGANAADPEGTKKLFSAFDKAFGGNAVSYLSGAGFAAAGAPGVSLDLGEYTQPFGGGLGARLASIKDTGMSGITNTVRAGVNAVEGKPAAAALHALAAASALNNFANFSGSIPGLNWLDKANSTTVTKVLSATGKSLEKEYNQDQTAREELKAVLGSKNIKREEK